MATVYSNRLEQHLHLGKKEARKPESSHVPLAELLKKVPANALPPIPKHFGHGYAFGRYGWLMLGNGPDDSVYSGFSGAGDCYWAGEAHAEMEAARIANRPIPKFSGKTIINQYAAYSGYNPYTGNNDDGTDLQEGIRWRQTKGIYDDAGHVYKIGQTVSLTPGNIHELWAAAYLFDWVGVGFLFQAAQMDQFDREQPWAYVPGSPNEGGHYVIVPGDNGYISWGMRGQFVPSWYEKLNDESYAYIDNERYNRVTGETAEHYSDQDLEKFVYLVTRVA